MRLTKAFTLAEVLITLGVIGVVAAVTMPTLVKNYQKHVTSSKLKKVYSALTQAYKAAEYEYGPVNTWEYPTVYTVDVNRIFIEKYIKPYFIEMKECSTGLSYDCTVPLSWLGVNYLLNDGTGLAIRPMIDGKYINIEVTTNNRKEASIMGKDHFRFMLDTQGVVPYGWQRGLTREKIKNEGFVFEGYNLACREETKDLSEEGLMDVNRHGCTALLYLDNFEFKKDYPW